MNKTPFYSVKLKDTGEDVTNYITSLSYESSVDKDDLIRMNVIVSDSFRLLDENFLENGQELIILFGYLGGLQSKEIFCRVNSKSVTFGKQVVFKIEAGDLTLLLKKVDRYDDWSGNTSSEIVKKIAQRNGFSFQIDESSKEHVIMLQGGKTDYEFLKKLALIEGSGYRFYMDGETMFFTKRDLLQDSSKVFDYQAKNEWIKMSISEKDNTKKSSSKSAEFRTTNPLTGELVSTKAEAKNTKQGALAEFTVHVNDRGEEMFSKPSIATKVKKSSDGRKIIGGSNENSSDNKGTADNYQRNSSMGDITASLDVIGNPSILSDSIITIEGVTQQYSGNWYVSGITHSISTSGYVTKIELNRNSTNLKKLKGGNIKNKKTNINKTIGKRSNDVRETLLSVDGNGNITQ